MAGRKCAMGCTCGRHVHAISPETRTKISAAKTGKPSGREGKLNSPEHRANISAAMKGKPSPFKGRALLPETRAKLSVAHTGKRLSPEHRAKSGPVRTVPQDDYCRRHLDVRQARGKASDRLCEGGCQGCAKDWATIHGRAGLDLFRDYVPLCRSCHTRYDKRKGVMP